MVPDLERTLSKEKKMAFISGPRQVGKTTLARFLLKEREKTAYFNWDIENVRRSIVANPVNFWRPVTTGGEGQMERIALDEIHKYPRWKRFLKGFFDANREEVEVVVTGSGRLDLYQRGGDSLFGRYHLYHLFPYSLGELTQKPSRGLSPESSRERIFSPQEENTVRQGFDALWRFSGFPEPLFKTDQRALIRWRNDHRQLIVREDLRDLTQIREIGLIESLIYLLPERIGSPLSVNALREDLNVSFMTVQNWLTALDRLYYLFPLRPFSGRLARTLRREEKIYFYDWSELREEGKRFENLVAVHLLKACAYWTDAGFGDFRLHYVRDKEKREVDFLITNENHPYWLIESKISEKEADRSLLYFHERLKPAESFQLIKEADKNLLSKVEKNVHLCSAVRFLAALP